MIYTAAIDSMRPYDHLPRETWPAIVCGVCGQPESGHRRDNQTCRVYERAAFKPTAARTRQRTVPSAWVLR